MIRLSARCTIRKESFRTRTSKNADSCQGNFEIPGPLQGFDETRLTKEEEAKPTFRTSICSIKVDSPVWRRQGLFGHLNLFYHFEWNWNLRAWNKILGTLKYSKITSRYLGDFKPYPSILGYSGVIRVSEPCRHPENSLARTSFYTWLES